MGREEEDVNEKNEEDLVGSIYKEGPPKEHEKQGGQKYKLSDYKDASIFGTALKDKIRCGYGGVKNGLNGR